MSVPNIPNHRLAARAGALLGTGCLLLAVSGCGEVKRDNNPNLIAGKQAFVAKCGACHTLARANTKGTVGPNLDEAFHASIVEGLRRSAVRTAVQGQVENPNRFGAMPSGLADGATLKNIAAYVAEAVDRPGKDSGLLASAVQAPGAGKPAIEKAGKLEIPADPTGQLACAGALLDRARAYPVLVRSLPKAVEGVTLRAQNRKVVLPDLEITVQEVYRFSKEDAVVFLLRLKNTTDGVVDLVPSTFAARVAQERFEQSIANGPRTLEAGESAEAEFAIVGLPGGTRNDLSADNAFTILINCARQEAKVTAAEPSKSSTEVSHP